MGRPPTPRHFQPIDSCTGDLDGEVFVINPREIFSADDPLVRAKPHLFRPVEPSRERPEVEQATAAPGETRF